MKEKVRKAFGMIFAVLFVVCVFFAGGGSSAYAEEANTTVTDTGDVEDKKPQPPKYTKPQPTTDKDAPGKAIWDRLPANIRNSGSTSRQQAVCDEAERVARSGDSSLLFMCTKITLHGTDEGDEFDGYKILAIPASQRGQTPVYKVTDQYRDVLIAQLQETFGTTFEAEIAGKTGDALDAVIIATLSQLWGGKYTSNYEATSNFSGQDQQTSDFTTSNGTEVANNADAWRLREFSRGLLNKILANNEGCSKACIAPELYGRAEVKRYQWVSDKDAPAADAAIAQEKQAEASKEWLSNADSLTFPDGVYDDQDYTDSADIPHQGHPLWIEQGWYLFRQTQKSDESKTYSSFMVQTAQGDTTHVWLKRSAVSVDLKMQDNDAAKTWTDVADYKIGDTVPVRAMATIPRNIDSFKNFTLKFHNEPQWGATLRRGTADITNAKDAAGNVKQEPLPKIHSITTDKRREISIKACRSNEYISNIATANFEPSSCTDLTEYAMMDFSTIDIDRFIVGFNDIQALKKSAGYTLSGTDVFVLEYSVRLNEEAVIGTIGNWVFVKLEFTDNRDGDGTSGNDQQVTPSNNCTTADQCLDAESTSITQSVQATAHTYLLDAKVRLGGYKPDKTDEPTFVLKRKSATTGEYEEFTSSCLAAAGPLDSTYLKPERKIQSALCTVYQKTKPVGPTEPTTESTGRDEYYLYYFSFEGLDSGTYQLSIVDTPAGYNPVDPVEFTINPTWGGTTSNGAVIPSYKLTSLGFNSCPTTGQRPITDQICERPLSYVPQNMGAWATVSNDSSTGMLFTEITLGIGPRLPEAGGPGTIVMRTIGYVMVACALAGSVYIYRIYASPDVTE